LCDIAKNYLKTFFWIDFAAVVPVLLAQLIFLYYSAGGEEVVLDTLESKEAAAAKDNEQILHNARWLAN
jgi:hypothetical protein